MEIKSLGEHRSIQKPSTAWHRGTPVFSQDSQDSLANFAWLSPWQQPALRDPVPHKLWPQRPSRSFECFHGE